VLSGQSRLSFGEQLDKSRADVTGADQREIRAHPA
jgi:hypothetical protein